MTREEAISHIKYMIKAYQNLIENDVRSGEAIGKDIKGEWKSEKTLADAYMQMIESLNMAIQALEQSVVAENTTVELVGNSEELGTSKKTLAVVEQEPKTEQKKNCNNCKYGYLSSVCKKPTNEICGNNFSQWVSCEAESEGI